MVLHRLCSYKIHVRVNNTDNDDNNNNNDIDNNHRSE